MARPLRIDYAGAFHHITARGNERKDIFKSIKDREQFLSCLSASRYAASPVFAAYGSRTFKKMPMQKINATDSSHLH